MAATTILETRRLLLREMTLDDLGFVASMLADPEVMRFFPRRASPQEAEDWLRRQLDRYASHGHGYWLAVERASGRPVGQAGLLTVEVEGVEGLALGYVIHRPFWGRGLATEAAGAMLAYAFRVLGRERVITLIRPEHVASRRVALKVGMRPEKRTLYMGYEHVVYCASPRRRAYVIRSSSYRSVSNAAGRPSPSAMVRRAGGVVR